MTFAYSPLIAPRARPVGVAGLEPAASSLSGMRSDRLSYTPPGVELAGLEPATSRLQTGRSPD